MECGRRFNSPVTGLISQHRSLVWTEAPPPVTTDPPPKPPQHCQQRPAHGTAATALQPGLKSPPFRADLDPQAASREPPSGPATPARRAPPAATICRHIAASASAASAQRSRAGAPPRAAADASWLLPRAAAPAAPWTASRGTRLRRCSSTPAPSAGSTPPPLQTPPAALSAGTPRPCRSTGAPSS